MGCALFVFCSVQARYRGHFIPYLWPVQGEIAESVWEKATVQQEGDAVVPMEGAGGQPRLAAWPQQAVVELLHTPLHQSELSKQQQTGAAHRCLVNSWTNSIKTANDQWC